VALIVEDGTGLVNAEAFASIPEVTAWMEGRDVLALWNGLVSGLPEKEAHAREAVDYLRGFGWLGRRSFVGQALDFPRAGIADVLHDAVPVELKNAQAYLMLERTRGGPLQPSWTGAPVKSKGSGGGIGKVFGGAGDAPVRHFPALSGMLRGLYHSAPSAGGGVTRRLVRV
jgi:hypothetical protein